jgi:Domain of unknown function (DUF4406)
MKAWMKVYLAGPMSGIKDHNMPLFDHVAAQLRLESYDVYSPADLTRNTYGSLEVFLTLSPETQRKALRMLLATELAWVCLYAKKVFLLPGWEKSRGARAEQAAAVACEIPCLPVPEEMLNLQVTS